MQTRPSPTFGRPVHLRGGPHRLQPGTSPHALPIPSHDEHPALRRITPPADDVVTAIFGYGAPHSSARGTSTLPNNALLSAHYEPLRHPTRPGLALASCQLIPTAITAGASRVASDPLCLHAVATTPAGPMERIRSVLLHRRRPSPDYRWVSSCINSFEACSAFTHVTTCRLAKSPYATLYTGGFSGFVASTAAPIATGRSDPVPGRAFQPAVDQRLSRRTATPC